MRGGQWVSDIPGKSLTMIDDKGQFARLVQQSRAAKWMPRTYVFPNDRKSFERNEKDNHDSWWIVKRTRGTMGRGMRVLRSPKAVLGLSDDAIRNTVVQSYIKDPQLIHGRKVSLRLHVLITSWRPLRTYIHQDGLMLLAPKAYSTDIAHDFDPGVHIPNYRNYKNGDIWARPGSEEHTKLSLSEPSSPVSMPELLDQAATMLRPVLELAALANKDAEIEVVSRGARLFKVIGVDLQLDAGHRPWLLEVNSDCAMGVTTPPDRHVKRPLLQDLLQVVGITRRSTRHGWYEKLTRCWWWDRWHACARGPTTWGDECMFMKDEDFNTLMEMERQWQNVQGSSFRFLGVSSASMAREDLVQGWWWKRRWQVFDACGIGTLASQLV